MDRHQDRLEMMLLIRERKAEYLRRRWSRGEFGHEVERGLRHEERVVAELGRLLRSQREPASE